jgi:hypothetical protein
MRIAIVMHAKPLPIVAAVVGFHVCWEPTNLLTA